MQRCGVGLNKGLFRLISLALLAALVLAVLGPGAARANPGWYDSNWQYRKKITINSANVSADLTDFPVLISLASDSDLRDDALNNGDDILFTKADEVTQLSHEIESFNGTSGKLVAWVKIPSLSSSVNTDIYMYYGNSGAGNQQNATAVWDSNYKMVQHLQESSGTHYDSTQYVNNGTEYIDAPGTQDATGQINGADYLDGNDDNVEIDSVVSDVGATDNGTFSCWMYSNEPDNSDIRCAGFGDTDANTYIYIGIINGKLRGKLKNAGTDQWVFETDANINDFHNWLHISLVQDGTEPVLYVDGTKPAQTFSVSTDKTQWFSDVGGIDNGRIGCYNQNNGGNTKHFDGTIDEVRLSDTARSADWILTGYNNQSNPSGFITLGSEETGGVPAVVGGMVYPVDKVQVLAPWLFLFLGLSLAAAGGALKLRQRAWSRFN